MSTMASQTTDISIVCSTVCSDTDESKHQSSAWLAFVRGIHGWAVNSPHKGPVTRIIFPFDDVIMHWTNDERGWVCNPVMLLLLAGSSSHIPNALFKISALIAKFMGLAWDPPGLTGPRCIPCWPHESCWPRWIPCWPHESCRPRWIPCWPHESCWPRWIPCWPHESCWPRWIPCWPHESCWPRWIPCWPMNLADPGGSHADPWILLTQVDPMLTPWILLSGWRLP